MLEGVTIAHKLQAWEGERQCPVSDDLADTFAGAASAQLGYSFRWKNTVTTHCSTILRGQK